MKSVNSFITTILVVTQHTIVKVKFFIFLYIIVFLIPSFASGTTYYVAKTGNDGNAGTFASPWLTIPDFYSDGGTRLASGDTVYVRAGTYAQILYCTDSGTAGDPTAYIAYPGDEVILSGTISPLSEATQWNVKIIGNYINFYGFHVTFASAGINVYGTHNIVRKCEVYNHWSGGISAPGDYTTIDSCTVYNQCKMNENGMNDINNTGWGSGLSIGHKEYPGVTHYGTIANNLVHDCWGEGISTNITDHVIVQNNTVYDSYSVNLYIMNSINTLVQNNLVYQTKPMAGPNGHLSAVGIGHWDERSYNYNANNTIINNISYENRKNFYSSSLHGCLVANNTFVNSTYEGCIEIVANPHTSTIFANNIIIQEGALVCIYDFTEDEGITFSNNLFNKSYDIDAVGPNDILGDPKLSKIGETGAGKLTAEYFKLLSTSPAINKGTVISQVTQDYFGNSRDATPDIGAHEYYAPDQAVKVTGIAVTGAGGATTITTDNGTLQLSAAVAPASATNKTVAWSLTSGTGQAIISTTGLVTAVVDGTVTARATANDGSGIYGTLVITISNQVIPVTSITVTGSGGATTITTDNGTLQLSVRVLPSNATNKAVTWSIANGTGQATISSSGLVTGVASGTVTARATANDGSGVYGTLLITISNQVIPVTSITVTGAGGATIITTDNGTLQLSSGITPGNATNQAVTWSISNGTGQASISAAGLVTAISNGTVTARATANDGSGIYGTLVITISNPIIPVTGITVSGAGGATTITTDNGTLQLSAAVSPSNATNQTVTWSISNGTGQASISSTGLVKAIASGTVTARATANDDSGIYGILVITILNQAIPNIPVYISSAVENANPSVMELTYDLNLANIVPATFAFSVQVNSVERNVNSVTISGTKVILTLASAIVYGDAVTIAYTNPANNPLQSVSGGQAASLIAQTVSNRVSIANTPPVVVVNYSSSSYSGIVNEINASGSFDSNNDNLFYTWVAPDNVPVSSTSGSIIKYLGPIVSSSQTVEFTLQISDGKTTQSKVIPIEILPYRPELEVAEISNIEASSFQSPYYPYNIIDGNIGTMWSANGDNQWLIIEFKQSFSVQHVKLAFQLGQRRESYFDILGSVDKVTWEPILIKSASCAFSGDIQVFDFPQSKTEKEFKYVKLVGQSNSVDSWNYISEFRIFGYRHRDPTSYKEQPVKIYPNPAHEFINIRIDETTLKLDFMRIVNLAGKIVFQDMMNPDIKDFLVPLSLMQGAYIVQLGSNGLTLFGQKLIISK